MSGIPLQPLAPPLRRRVLRATLLLEGGLGVVAIGLGWLFGVSATSTLRWESGAALLGAVAIVPMLAMFSLVWRLFPTVLADTQRKLERLILRLFSRATVPELALVAVAAGVGEELLFRGFLQGALAAPLGDWGGLVVASLLFGLAHPITTAYGVVVAAMGMYLGALWLWSGNLLAPIVAHALYDLVALLVLIGRERSAILAAENRLRESESAAG